MKMNNGTKLLEMGDKFKNEEREEWAPRFERQHVL